MEVYRISSTKYSKTLTASGSANRWNRRSQYVLYTGEARSLSMLETVVHKAVKGGIDYETMIISIADDDDFYTRVALTDLPPNWREVAAYPDLQIIGSDWYQTNKSLVLVVPSVIVPQERNYVINTNHPDFRDHVTLVRQEPFILDSRL